MRKLTDQERQLLQLISSAGGALMMRTAKLKEWIGKNAEAMPGQTVLLRLYAKQNGICACGCSQMMNLNRDKVDCDHITALIDGGENRESNLQLLLHPCHKLKTGAEATARSEERRHKAKAFTALRKPQWGNQRLGSGNQQRRATTAIPPKFPGDILARKAQP